MTKHNLPDPVTLLSQDVEPVPDWLANFKAGDRLPFEAVVKSRVVYYPACCHVWKDVQIFGNAEAAHCFVRADFSLPLDDVKRQIIGDGKDNVFREYRVVDYGAAEKRKFTDGRNGNWEQKATERAARDFLALGHMLGDIFDTSEVDFPARSHVDNPELWHNHDYREPEQGAFVFWAVLEKEAEGGSTHISSRIAILHLGIDAFVGFDVLFMQKGNTLPYAVHGRRFPYAIILDGACYDGWAFGGIAPGPAGGRDCDFLEFLCRNNFRKRPKWLLIKDDVPAWPQYVQKSESDVDSYCAGRKLFLRRGQKIGNDVAMPEKERMLDEQ